MNKLLFKILLVLLAIPADVLDTILDWADAVSAMLVCTVHTIDT